MTDAAQLSGSAARARIPPTPRSPPRSTSWATCTSSTAPSIHRIVAYRNAAKAVRDASVSVDRARPAGARHRAARESAASSRRRSWRWPTTARSPPLVKMRAKFPPGLVEITQLPGLGPKRARRLYEELGIDSLDALRAAAEEQRIRELKGFGPKAEESILGRVCSAAGAGERRRARGAQPCARGRRAAGRGAARAPGRRARGAGRLGAAYDRQRQGPRHHRHRQRPARAGPRGRRARRWSSRPATRATRGVRLRTHSGHQVDLRIVEPDQFGNLLQHLTGSKEHNMALRDAAVRKGLHVSEYGVLDDATGETHRCATEAGGLRAARDGLHRARAAREPRRARGGARTGTLPELIELGDLRGDLHCHTTASDGTASIEEMAQAALDAGYEYLAITDHSASDGLRRRCVARAAARQIERIRALDADVDGIAAAGRLGGQHPARRLARLRRRAAGRARLGDRQRPHLVPDAGRAR